MQTSGARIGRCSRQTASLVSPTSVARCRIASRRPCVDVHANAIRARWCIDVQYGHKQTATALLQEWVADVGARAGLTPANTRLSSGSVGVAESRLELEVSFPSLSDWELFLGAIPAKEHRAWSQRVQAMIVGGSPRWELFRAVSAFPEGHEAAAAAAGMGVSATSAVTAAAASRATPPSSSLLAIPQASDVPLLAANGAWFSDAVSGMGGSGSSSITSQTSSSGSGSGLSIVDNQGDAEVVLDWKGEPLKINPGDKLPFKFL